MNERDIFIEALQRPALADRQAYLLLACADDDPLRRRVENLIAAFEQAGSFLQEPSSPPVATLGNSSIPWANPLGKERAGSLIGPYRLIEPIGEGGMGTVFLAEQIEPVRRKVALKVIKPGMDTRQVIARFEAERQALALMDHPNIARVLDAGATESGRPYFVMERVHGTPITEYCNRQQSAVRERLELFVLVCRAVQHAHQKGVIHRDLKPSNVLVTVVDGAAVPKVIDFGVAKATGQSLTDQTLLTGLHQFLGTPLYMSPEQAELMGADIDTRSDIYSLGVLLYELLTGTTPFDPATLRKAAFDEVRRFLSEQEPPTPSTRLRELGTTLTADVPTRPLDARKLVPIVRGELDWIVMKALEKDRNRRYETANGFAADVVRYLNDQPVEACPPSRWYPARKFVRRHRGRLTAVVLIGVLGLSLAAALGRQAMEQAARQAETASAATQALDAADRAMGQSKWADALASVNQAQALLTADGRGALALRCRRLKDDLALIARLDAARQQMAAVKDDHFDLGLADRLYGEAFRDHGIDVDALSPAAVASRMPSGPVREEMIAALDDWMRIRRQIHRKDNAGWQRLLAAARAVDPDAWRNRVREAWVTDDKKALGELTASAPFDRLHPCDVILLEANLDNDRAVAVLREAQRRRPGDFWLNHALGMRLHGMGSSHLEEAIGYLRTASALRPESPGAVLNVGHVLHQAERFDEAIAAYQQAIRLKPDYVGAYVNLGAALIDAKRIEEAIRVCREATRLNPDSAGAHGNLGQALTEAGELDEAIASLRVAMRLEPGSTLAARPLVDACCRKLVTVLQVTHRLIDDHVVRLPSPRPFLQTLLDPRSPPMLRRHFLLNLLTTAVLASPAFAGKPQKYVFTSFEPPGATYTRGEGVNNNGTIVGYFTDATGLSHGYLYQGGAITQFDVPGAVVTEIFCINDAGTMVGKYNFNPGINHGFILSGGSLTTFDVPGSVTTEAKGINLAGNIVGKATDAAGVRHGFLLVGGNFTSIDYPGAAGTQCWKINNNGQIVGDYQDAAGSTHGYILSGGRFTAINFPNAKFTQPMGINDAGQVVGRYYLANGVSHGFLLSNGTYTTIDYPNATETYLFGITNLGELVGQANIGGRFRGFYAVKQ